MRSTNGDIYFIMMLRTVRLAAFNESSRMQY